MVSTLAYQVKKLVSKFAFHKCNVYRYATVKMQGACDGCPSSSVTLKSGGALHVESS
jgi:Fe-S cluster biogenesis protein NfuA